jgi:hypothetical protein
MAATATDLVFAEQFSHLREVADNRGWDLKEIEGPGFVLGLLASDESRFWLKVECDGFQGIPPAWHWHNPETGALDAVVDTPKGNGYFHSSGRVCAPWNRLAYKSVDAQGPHSDWQLSNWMSNPKTGHCTTLTAMALRISVEFHGPRFKGRMG